MPPTKAGAPLKQFTNGHKLFLVHENGSMMQQQQRENRDRNNFNRNKYSLQEKSNPILTGADADPNQPPKYLLQLPSNYYDENPLSQSNYSTAEAHDTHVWKEAELMKDMYELSILKERRDALKKQLREADVSMSVDSRRRESALSSINKADYIKKVSSLQDYYTKNRIASTLKNF